MFNVFGEGYLCLLKIYLFLGICGLHFIQFSCETYLEKVLQELSWAPIPFKWYQNTCGCGTGFIMGTPVSSATNRAC